MLVQFSCGSGVSTLSSNLKEEVHIEFFELFCCILLIDSFKDIIFSICKCVKVKFLMFRFCSIIFSSKDTVIFICYFFGLSVMSFLTHSPTTLQVGDIEVDAPSPKRLRRSPSDALQDMVSGEELSLYGSAPNRTESAQVVFCYAQRK